MRCSPSARTIWPIMLAHELRRTCALSAALLAAALFSPIAASADDDNPFEPTNPFAPQVEPKSGLFAGLFGPSNYWECVLDKMPGSQNELAARVAAVQCRQKFPDGVRHQVAPSDKTGYWLGWPTAKDCFLKHGKGVGTEWASRMIYAACKQLYVE